MKLFALSLILLSSSAFASTCFTRLDSDLGLKLSKQICLNSVLVEKGVAYVSADFDGVQKMKKIVVGQGTKTSRGVVYKLEDLEAIYTSDHPECSRALEAHVYAEITVNQSEVSFDKVAGEFIEKGDYCYDDGHVTGIIRYVKN